MHPHDLPLLPRAGQPGRPRHAARPHLPDPGAPFSILSISGGGTSVLASARALAALETRLGWPLRRRFDLLAGTSAGGILALAVAAAVPLHAFADAWAGAIGAIFSASPAPKSRTATLAALAASLLRSRHDGVALRAFLATAFPRPMRLHDLPARVLLPSIDLTQGAPRVLRTHHSPHAPHAASWHALDAALATSAAPVFLPIHRAHGSAWADGGLYANAPDTLALMEAIGPLEVDVRHVRMLSLGTAWSLPPVLGEGPPLPWGAKDWARGQRVLTTAMLAQQQAALEQCKAVLGRRYTRLEAQPTPAEGKILSLDAADDRARAALERMGQDLCTRLADAPALDALARHHAPHPVFGPL